MKKMINFVKNLVNKAVRKVNRTVERVKNLCSRNRRILTSACGEGYIDSAVKIIIGVVIGGVLLAGLYALFNNTILPTLSTKIGEMFSYAG